MTLRVLSLSHQAAAAYKGKGRSQPTCRARGCRDRLGIPKPPPPGGGHAPRGAPSTRAARLLGRTHRPRLPGARCPRATLCQRPPCVSRAAHHRAKRRVGVWCSLPMLGPCAQRQRYATACCAYRPTFIRCLSINPPPPGHGDIQLVFYTWVARSRSESSSFTVLALNKPSSSGVLLSVHCVSLE